MERAFRPSERYRPRELHPELAQRLQEVLRLPQAPATLGEVVELLAAKPRKVLPADLWCQGSRHRVTTGGETRHARCVVDALMVAVAKGGVVESRSPLLGQKVVVKVDADGSAVVAPPTAVFSYGVAKEGEHVYQALCPYLLAFAAEDEYRRWAEATPEALTVVLAPEEAVSLASALAASFLGGAFG